MTHAVAIFEPGGPEVLRVIERDVRDPGPGEVRLAVRAAAVNPTDIGLRARGEATIPPPWIPGMDAAGTVESVGAGVEGLAVGDEVMAVATPRRADGGAQSELLVVPAASVVPIPAGATIEQAATLPMNGLTAFRGLELLGLDAGCDAPRHRRRRASRVLRDPDCEAARPAGARRRCSGGRGARPRLRRRRRRAERRRLRRGGARGGSRRRRRRLRHRAAGSPRVSGDPRRRRARLRQDLGRRRRRERHQQSARSGSRKCSSGRTGCTS